MNCAVGQIARISDRCGNNAKAGHFGVRQMFTLIRHMVKLKAASSGFVLFGMGARFLVRGLG